MLRLTVIAMLLTFLPGCEPRLSASDFEAELDKQHSLEDLLIWHERAVSEDGKDLFFIQPIGRFGRDGVVASLDHIAGKDRAAYSNNDLRLILGVLSASRREAGYDLCRDKRLLREHFARPAAPGVSLRRRSQFVGQITSFCVATEKLKACLEEAETPATRQTCEEGRALLWGQ